MVTELKKSIKNLSSLKQSVSSSQLQLVPQSSQKKPSQRPQNDQNTELQLMDRQRHSAVQLNSQSQLMSSLKSPQNFNQFYSIQNLEKQDLQKPLETEHSTEYAVREFYSDDTEKQEDVLDRERELNSTQKVKISITPKHEKNCAVSTKSPRSSKGHNTKRQNNLSTFKNQSFRLRQSLSESKCSRNKNLMITASVGASIFKSRYGISAQMTPVSKRFAPRYATTHSLIANTISCSTEKTMLEQKQDILTKLAPSNQ